MYVTDAGSETLDELKEIMADFTDLPEISPTTNTPSLSSSLSSEMSFLQLGGNSLSAIRITNSIYERLGVHIDLKELYQSKSLSDLTAHILSLSAQSTQVNNEHLSDKTVALMEEDMVLPEDIKLSYKTDFKLKHPLEIFLTGGTGFTGTVLLHELLQLPHAKIHCLVRANTREEALERLKASSKNALRKWLLSYDSRITVVLGNLGDSHFGLSNAEFDELASKVNVVVHVAASVNFLMPFSALRRVNVLGTKDILRLVCLGKPKILHYFSTTSIVKGHLRKEVPLERYPKGNLAALGGYNQSKYVSEILVTEAALKRGISAVIYRPGMISFCTETGFANVTDKDSRFLSAALQMKVAPHPCALPHSLFLL